MKSKDKIRLYYSFIMSDNHMYTITSEERKQLEKIFSKPRSIKKKSKKDKTDEKKTDDTKTVKKDKTDDSEQEQWVTIKNRRKRLYD